MKKFNQTKLLSLFTFIAVIAFCCKKKATEISSQGNLQIFKNSSLANSKNALQALYATTDNKFKGYYYGTFNSKGEPDSIKSLVIQKSGGTDTSINFTFNNNLKVKSIYITYGNRRDTTLFSCDYSILNQTSINVYFYDYTTNKSRLKYTYVVNDLNSSLVSSKKYASVGGGLSSLLSMLLQINTGGSPDPWMSKFITTQGAIGIINAVTIGVGAFGCTISFPACVLGAIVVAYVGTSPASASTITSSSTVSGPNAPTEPGYKIGDIYGGGVIVSLDNSGVHGVTCSPGDQSPGATWQNAITIASSYNGGGFTNWRLPTYSEITALYDYNAIVGNFNRGCTNFTECTYWTSDQNGGSFAWAMYFNNGTFWNNYGTTSNARVRAVRSF